MVHQNISRLKVHMDYSTGVHFKALI